MEQKVVGFMASPRRNGNTEMLLDKALEGAKERGAEIEKVVLRDLKFVPCQACGGCEKTGVCVIKDDFQSVYKLLKESNFFILATPLYFSGVSAYGKSMFDRCQCIWVAKYRLRKPIAPKSSTRRGVLISSRGMPGIADFEHVRAEVKSFFSVNNIVYFDEVLIDDCDGKGPVRNREDVLQKACSSSQRLITG